MQIFRGSCHCGRIAFEVEGTPDVLDCNCSICSKKGFLHWIVPPERFRLLTPRENMATYRFNTQTAQHHFCPTCGIAPFYIPRSDPDKIDVNVRCLDDFDLSRCTPRPFDGRNWESSFASYRLSSTNPSGD